MPYWILAGIDTDRVSGRLYSGFGGVNYSVTELPKESVRRCIQVYRFQLTDLVKNSHVTLKRGFEWLLQDKPWEAADAPKDWDDLKKLAA